MVLHHKLRGYQPFPGKEWQRLKLPQDIFGMGTMV